MADQKEMKKRLKVLMKKPENQMCSDCPERQPRWASLIVPPPGSPPGAAAIGALCCLECSGSHRRLGVHISFVRSINLDSWKEKEVMAMENGGNRKVNAIWEANLERAGGRKPVTGADLTTRERYVRDKYERRKFYDPQALVEYQSSEPSFDDMVTRNQGANEPAGFADFGPPADEQISDAAKMRAKKKKSLSRNQSFDAPVAKPKSSGDGPKKSRMKRQESMPEPVIDLLDMGGMGGTPAPPPASNAPASAPFGDFFGAEVNGGAPPAAGAAAVDPSKQRSTRSRSKNRSDMRTKSKTPDREKTRKAQQQDILSMYGAGAPTGGGMVAGGGMAIDNNMAANPANMMAMMQQMQQMNMNNPQQQQQMGMNPQQQQQQQMQQPGFGAGQAPAGGAKHNSRLAMHQNLMMQNMQSQMQQQQNMQQQMQRMMQQQGANPNNMAQQGGGMNPNTMNPQMMQAMMNANKNTNNMMQGGQGMPNGGGSMMGMNPNMMGTNPNTMMMGMNPNMMQQPTQQQQMNQFGGMPMGGTSGMSAQNGKAAANKPPAKDDPFAQFGMNAFR